MKKFFICIFIVFLALQVFGQKLDAFDYRHEMDTFNYVKNPSFEDFTECPKVIDRLNRVKYWRVPPGAVLHSPNFFHRCSNEYPVSFDWKAGVPENVFGYQEPRRGNGYIGFGTFSRYKYVENVQSRLKQPLRKGEIYRIGMYVSLSEKSKYANDRFTFCLTDQSELEIVHKQHKRLSKQHLICPNGFRYISDELLTDTLNWVNIELEYTAIGGEKYLTLGVFDGDIGWWERQRKIRNIFNENWDTYDFKVPGAHYYVDDVYVIRLEDYLNMMQNDENE